MKKLIFSALAVILLAPLAIAGSQDKWVYVGPNYEFGFLIIVIVAVLFLMLVNLAKKKKIKRKRK